MHFFNPPMLMKLVEVVAAEHSSTQALVTTSEVAVAMGRTPIRAKDTPGFVANRLARPFSLESLRMLGDGVADAATIDRIVRLGGGFRMGPFELIDLIGLDVNLTIARSFFVQGGEPERWRPSPIQERLVEEGKLGRKSGQGYYSYEEGRGASPTRSWASRPPASTPSSWRRSTRRRAPSSAVSSPRLPTRPHSRSKKRSPRPRTWKRRCGSVSIGRWAHSAWPKRSGPVPRSSF